MPVPSQHAMWPTCAYFSPCLNQPTEVYLCVQPALRACAASCQRALPVQSCLCARAASCQRALSVHYASAMPPLGMTLTWSTLARGP
ncbi:hypothetical protein L484_014039 [Morus notabilis]|uniref:Uncharacterized protein n=1 Tax=Morus notabilis TaxID=981085 RepID=W9RBJ9_9ROSA|nr:hypothetical protein L484_014039 [Morus notabilis]